MRVLVTGACGGIGSAIVEELLDEGHEVVAHDLRPNPGIGAHRNRAAQPMFGDLLATHDLAALRRTLGSAPLHAVIAAHGTGGAGAVADLLPDYIDHVLRVNFLSVTTLYAATQDLLHATQGSFVAVSSQAGLRGEAFNSAYCASKFALVGWARGVAQAHPGDARVRVLCPGATDTELFRTVSAAQAAADGVTVEEIIGRRVSTVALGRLARPAEVAAAAIWLAQLATPTATALAFNGGDTLY